MLTHFRGENTLSIQCVEPDSGGRVQRRKLGELGSSEEVHLHVADAVFHPSLLVSLGHPAGGDAEAVVSGEVEIPGILHRGLSRHPAKGGEGALAAGEEILHVPGHGEFHTIDADNKPVHCPDNS